MKMQRTVLFLNGKVSDLAALKAEIRSDDFHVCADGGAAIAHSLGIKPSVVIGDFDSISEELLQEYKNDPDILIQHFPKDKDKTDFELCLDYLSEKGTQELLLVGALGGRVDHELANIFTLGLGKHSIKQCAVFDGVTWIFPLTGPSEISLSSKHGKTLSLIPLTAKVKGVSLSGVKWELHNDDIKMDESRTISNEINQDIASLILETGNILAIQTP